VRGLLPGARIYVCDNNSRDGTSEEAQVAGAIVLFEPILGKGNAVRRLLRDVDSDVYVMVDGDNTYDLSFLPAALEDFVANHFDLMTGNRLSGEHAFMRRGHGMANRLFSQLIRSLLDVKTADVFSGFRIMSRRLIRSFPLF
jgi:glycosyltransferase involved in cell wall biosynthesis